MPFTYRRRITLIPGLLYLNVNRKSVSVTTALGPVRHTRSTSGRRTTSVNLPGRGLGYRHTSTSGGRHRGQDEDDARRDAERERLRARIAARRERIRRMRNREL